MLVTYETFKMALKFKLSCATICWCFLLEIGRSRRQWRIIGRIFSLSTRFKCRRMLDQKGFGFQNPENHHLQRRGGGMDLPETILKPVYKHLFNWNDMDKNQIFMLIFLQCLEEKTNLILNCHSISMINWLQIFWLNFQISKCNSRN